MAPVAEMSSVSRCGATTPHCVTTPATSLAPKVPADCPRVSPWECSRLEANRPLDVVSWWSRPESRDRFSARTLTTPTAAHAHARSTSSPAMRRPRSVTGGSGRAMESLTTAPV